jgi:hypothetical protein
MSTSTSPVPKAPSGPQHSPPKKPGSSSTPLVIVGAAFGIGTLLAKVIDWRGHAHPRR